MEFGNMNNPPMPPPSFPSPQSTPFAATTAASPRPQRPRFGFHAPSPYPRPRSSASKPNPCSSFGSIQEEPNSNEFYPNPDDYSYMNPRNENYEQNRPANISFSNASSDSSCHGSAYNDSSYNESPYNESPYNESFNASYMKAQISAPPYLNKPNAPYMKGQNFTSPYLKGQNAGPPFMNPQNSPTPYVKGQNSPLTFMKPQNSPTPYMKGQNNPSPYMKPQNTPTYGRINNNAPFSGSFSNPNHQNKSFGSTSFSSPDGDSSYNTCSESSFTNTSNYGNNFFNNQPPMQQSDSNQKRGVRGSGINKRRGRMAAFFGNTTPRFDQGAAEESPQQKQFPRAKKRKAPSAAQLHLRCELCGIDFTSQIPFDMHRQGAKHVKKMKAAETLKLLQSQGHAKPTDTEVNVFRCETCDVSLNGALQLQTHFEGSRHKNKIQALQKPEEQATAATQNGKQVSGDTVTSFEVGNTDVAPTEASASGNPAKMQKLSCDLCGITVNSALQLDQHMESKKHKAKVEGKPLSPYKKFKKKKAKEDGTEASEAETPAGDPAAVAIPDINTSFVKPEVTTE